MMHEHVAGRVHPATLDRLSKGVAQYIYGPRLHAALEIGYPNLGQTCYLGVASRAPTPRPTHSVTTPWLLLDQVPSQLHSSA